MGQVEKSPVATVSFPDIRVSFSESGSLQKNTPIRVNPSTLQAEKRTLSRAKALQSGNFDEHSFLLS